MTNLIYLRAGLCSLTPRNSFLLETPPWWIIHPSDPALVDYSPECVEGEFCELRLYGVLRSSRRPATFFERPSSTRQRERRGLWWLWGNGLHAPWREDLCGLLPGCGGGPRGSKGLLLAVVVAHLRAPPQDPGEGPLLLRSPWSGPAE